MSEAAAVENSVKVEEKLIEKQPIIVSPSIKPEAIKMSNKDFKSLLFGSKK